jgi:branched-chain amino acid transport system ATP-binding protein
MTVLLAVEGLRKRFGALPATDDVRLDVRPGECHAVIGPNGAGKSTLLAQIAGTLRPDAGSVRFAGADITALPATRRQGLGIGRTHQVPRVFASLSAADNVAVAVDAQGRGGMRRWLRSASDPRGAAQDAVMALLAETGLAERAATPAGILAHGERRWLELAIALAGAPRLLLLDEPAAGLAAADGTTLLGLLRALKPRIAMLLVEHDMDLVFALADRVTVLAGGRVVCSGPPARVAADPAARAAYLDDDAAAPEPAHARA